MRADQQAHVLEAQPGLVERVLELAQRARLVQPGVHQHHAVARRDRERVHVRHPGPGQRQAQPPQAGQHSVGARELALAGAHGSDQHARVEDARGSTAALAARSASANGSGRWRSYQGRWSRPTAWWCVIVPPAASIASEAAALISSHCSSSRPAPRRREHREVGRRAVRVDVREAAVTRPSGPSAAAAARAPSATKSREAVPGDRGLERLGEDAGRDQRVAQVGHLEEGVAPGALATRRASRVGRPRRRASQQLERLRHPGVERVVGGLEAEHEQRLAVRRRAGQRRLARVEQAAVRRVQAATARARAPPRRPARTSRRGRAADALKRGRAARAPTPR